MERGLLHLYCGDGKGKTTAAVGLCVRAAGRGKQVLFTQFLKSEDSGERAMLRLLPGVLLTPCPEQIKFVFQMTEKEKAEAGRQSALLLADAFRLAEDKDLLVLDEVFGALSTGLLKECDLLSCLSNRPAGLEVVLTGREPPEAVLSLADYVTEMRRVRHPFSFGVGAREGIEF